MGMKGSQKPAGGMAGHSHPKRQAPSSIGLNSFSLFIAKGNEGDSTTFGVVNSTSVKSGYWIGKDDKLTSTAEVVNYKSVPQDVYLTIDIEYVNVNGPRPANYLDVTFGSIQVESCGSGGSSFYLCMGSIEIYVMELTDAVPPKDRAITYKSPDWTVGKPGYIVGLSKCPIVFENTYADSIH
jgi:hypothetical protein